MKINEKEIKLYYPNGGPIKSIDAFLDFYSKCYYIDNNKEVEDVIDNILKTGIKSPVELFRVLAWKFGKIDMKKSKENAFVYKGSTDEQSMKLQIPRRKALINKSDIEGLYERIKECSGDFDDDIAKKFLTDIKTFTEEKSWKNHFGSVYMITLLYFVSKGKYPIVDSFAYVALEAIYRPIDFGKRIGSPDFNQLYKSGFDKTFTKGYYAKYIARLEELFGEKVKSREVDQALWVYGKLFKK